MRLSTHGYHLPKKWPTKVTCSFLMLWQKFNQCWQLLLCVTMCAADPHTLWFPLKLLLILSCKKIWSILKCLWMKNFKTFKHCIVVCRRISCSILAPLRNCLYIFYFHYYILFSILEGSTCCAANLTAWALILLVADVLVTSFSSCNSTQQQFMLCLPSAEMKHGVSR